MSDLWTEEQVEEADRRLTNLGHVAMSVLIDTQETECEEAWELIHELHRHIDLMQSKLTECSDMIYEADQIGTNAIKKINDLWERGT